MGARMLGKFSKPARTTEPNCTRTTAVTTAERPQHVNRRRDGSTARGPHYRARHASRGRLSAASPRVADRLRRLGRNLLLAGAAALAAVSVGPSAATATTL